MKKVRTRYQTETITLAGGVATTKETKVDLDSQFDEMVGYTVHSVVQNAADKFKLGITDSSGVLQDRTYENDHISSTSVAPKDRYKDLRVPAKGHQIIIQVEPLAALAGTLTIDVVMKLEEEICN